MSSTKLIFVVLLLGTAIALADHALSIAQRNNAMISARSYKIPLVTGFAQSALGQADFSLSTTSSFQSTTPGNSANYGVTITFTSATTGFYGDVALSVTGLPPGGTRMFRPSSL